MKKPQSGASSLGKLLGFGALAAVAVLSARLVFGQSNPGLSISMTGSNAVVLTVTNGVSNLNYQLYWTEFLNRTQAWTPQWLLLTNGSLGQTQFVAQVTDLEAVYFRAAYNTNFVAPSISVLILSPTNGMLLQ